MRVIVFMRFLFILQRKGMKVTKMIELFERTLVKCGDLETAKTVLLNEANNDRMNRITQIEHDYRIAMLIKECLIMEPKGSSGYAVSKGIMHRLQEKYRDRENEKTVRKLMRETKKEKAVKNSDQVNREEEQTCCSGTE